MSPATPAIGLLRPICFGPCIPGGAPSFSNDCVLIPNGLPRSPGRLSSWRRKDFRSRSASTLGPDAEFSEQLVGTEKKKKRRTVAGVDQDELVDPVMLADADSAFYEFKGVQIHHKVCHCENEQIDQTLQGEDSSEYADGKTGSIGLPMILLHGFGASVFSWSQVMEPLARLIGSKVLAFDRPAFGLTSRSRHFGQPGAEGKDTTPLNPHSMAFSVLATLSFMDMLSSEKTILVGHSAGCLVAVNTYFEAPERVAALVFVAPAIVAPVLRPTSTKDNQEGKREETKQMKSVADIQGNVFTAMWSYLSTLASFISQVAVRIIKGIRNMVASFGRNILAAILRSALSAILVRKIIDTFGIMAIRNAWCNPNRITDHSIHGYTKPLKIKGWEAALLEYTFAMLTDTESESKTSLARRLADISCPVLIITGDTDRLVPAWNSKRLASVIPRSTFEVIKDCGHLPHEERVEEFLLVIKRFLHRTFSTAEESAFASNY